VLGEGIALLEQMTFDDSPFLKADQFFLQTKNSAWSLTPTSYANPH